MPRPLLSLGRIATDLALASPEGRQALRRAVEGARRQVLTAARELRAEALLADAALFAAAGQALFLACYYERGGSVEATRYAAVTGADAGDFHRFAARALILAEADSLDDGRLK